MRWGENETLQFAKLYIRYQDLWNRKHPHYKMKDKRLHAYKELIAQFYEATGIKLNVVEVKVKIKNLRSTYYQELQKIRQRSNEEWTFTPTLKWFNEWHKTLGVALDLGGIDQSQQDINEPCTEIFMVPSKHDDGDPFTEEHVDNKLIDLKSEPNESTSSNEITYKTKKKKIKKRSLNSSDRQSRYSIDSGSETNKEDEFDIYGKYIATQLRKMDLRKALRVQLQIQNLVGEARLSDNID